ncbi:MAG TPA: SDR family oxidoreductase [Terriglobia bacterium]|nr:SDR family oxidoreductase [Terriglobia bacterium]
MDGSPTSDRGAVLITGSSTGIGEACALHLDTLGFRVYAGVRRDADGEALRQKSSGRITLVHLDVTDLASVAAARATIERQETKLAGLVNNAGIVAAGPLEILPLEEFRRQLEVNVIGQLAVTQAFIPLLRKARGRIVMMGSISGRIATPFIGAYAASKYALEAMTDALRVELMPWGIEVAIVEPGSIATPIWEKSRQRSGEIARGIVAERRELYHLQYEAMRKAAKETGESGIPASEVARVVEHALTAARPRTRYLVGKDAKQRARLAKFIPDRILDRIIVKKLGLPAKA